MVTSKPISTLCWNSPEFLYKVLKRLYEQDYITFYSYIYHFAEVDETKNHWHLYIVPNGRIDTTKLREEFAEIESNNDKPNRPLPFENSQWQDWYLYSLHDPQYLASKGMERKYHYLPEEFINSDNAAFTEKVHSMDLHKLKGTQLFVDCIDSGMKFKDLVKQGIVPIQQIHQFERAYDLIKFGSVGGLKGGSLTTPENPT